MNLFFLIILLASFQGIIIAILLFRLQHNKRANRVLAILLVLIAVAGINLYLSTTGWYLSSTPRAILHALVPGTILMPVGPLIYLYIRESTNPDFKISKKHRWYFWPVIIDLVPQITTLLFFVSAFAKIPFFSVPTLGKFIDNYNVYADIPRWISMTLYLLISYRYIQRISPSPASKLFAVERQVWLNHFVRLFLLFQLLWLPFLIFYCIPSFTTIVLEKLGWFPVYVPLAIFIYYIGFKGYLLSWAKAMADRRSGMVTSQEIHPSIIEAITRSMEIDKKYLDPLLDLPALARHTSIPVKTISTVLNQHFKRNFSDYLNSYRVAECQGRMKDPAYSNFTIVGIAADCGFNSPSTFQRVFKEITGTLPSQYRKSNTLEAENLQ
jgi:AraC-like DNA-binding protein